MSGSAIFFMIVAMVTVWGGLAFAIVHLARHPDESSGDLANGIEGVSGRHL